MKFIILVERQAPGKPLLLFITPDDLDNADLTAMFSEAQREKYVVHVLYSDQPTVVGTAEDIKNYLAEEG